MSKKEIAAAAILSVDAETVITIVCEVYQVAEKKLLTSRRGVANVPRDLAIYTLRCYSHLTLAEIG